jgi:hypothetical protein
MNAGVQLRDISDGWIGISALINPRLFEVEGKSNRVKIELADPDGVPLEPGVHIPLNLPTQGLVDEISEDKYND